MKITLTVELDVEHVEGQPFDTLAAFEAVQTALANALERAEGDGFGVDDLSITVVGLQVQREV